jgi:hypothetical protein
MIHGTDYECATAQFLFEVSNGILNPNLNTSNHDFHYKRKKTETRLRYWGPVLLPEYEYIYIYIYTHVAAAFL